MLTTRVFASFTGPLVVRFSRSGGHSARVGITQLQDEERYEICDVHRRIRNILDNCPAVSWTLDESILVLNVLSGIVRTRQALSDVIDLATRRALSSEALTELGQ